MLSHFTTLCMKGLRSNAFDSQLTQPAFTFSKLTIEALEQINNRNTRTKCEICSKLTINVFIVTFEHISHLVLVFLLLTLNM